MTVDLSGSMLEAEELILRAVNAVGNVATTEALKKFDADGDPIVVGGRTGIRKASCRRFIILPMGGFGDASRLSAGRRRKDLLPDG